MKFEGTLLKDPNVFSYFMLIAFEASGLIRFALLLTLWPAIRLLEAFGRPDEALNLTIFVATSGIPLPEIEAVARAVLPKFYMDDVDLEKWRAFRSRQKRVVVSRMPRVMVEMFAKEHLKADEVVGSELSTNRFGLVTGFVKSYPSSLADDSFVKEQRPPSFDEAARPHPVVFHDGRLVKRPTPSTALLILLWIPIGALLAFVRITVGLMLPMRATRRVAPLLGSRVVVRGSPPPPSGSGVLFVCTHRTLMDPVVLSSVLRRRVPAVTYSISRFSEILSPIPTVRLTRIREVDARRIEQQLREGDLVVCPEGTTCREPFLLRFSALFAELTDQIVPVAMNYKVGFFHATTARGWKGMDPIFFFMNPRPVYEVTFLNQLPVEATCSSGKSPHDVANYVQRILGATLGFECTNFTRKDKYRVLAGNDGIVSQGSSAKGMVDALKKVVASFIVH